MPAPKQTAKARASARASKALMNELTETGKQLNSTSAEFLKVDVETALTFAGLALETDNQEKKKRNCKNARKAYNTIQRLSQNVTFNSAEEAYMEEKMGRLKRELTQLGERF